MSGSHLEFFTSPSFLRSAVRHSTRVLRRAFQRAKRLGASESPAAVVTWLLDNQSYLRSHLKDCSESLSKSYCRKLARAEAAPEAGEPRIYRIVSDALLARPDLPTAAQLTDSLQPERLKTSLTLVELWAVPSMARLILLEELGRTVNEQELESPGCESRVKMIIKSLRGFDRVRWRDSIESISVVERYLMDDPAGIYPRMTFESRDQYRKAVERIAIETRTSEEEVARQAVAFAREESETEAGTGSRAAHVGSYLLNETGIRRLCERKKWISSPWVRLRTHLHNTPDLIYLGGIGAAEVLVLLVVWRLLGPFPWWWMAILSLPLVQTAASLFNLIINLSVQPVELPRLDFSKGIPKNCRTAIAIPTLLLSRDGITKLVKQLEIHYLANRDANLRFVLLTDFADSPSSAAGDDDLLNLCSEGVERLNIRHGTNGKGPFYLFHRSRRWNESEGVWMGRERKRGKLEDFNRLLLDEADAFEVKTGRMDSLGPIRYVITLDTDTQLPRDTAWKLVGTLAHPLNEAVVDPITKLVREGYAILQPRVSIGMEASGASRLARIYSGDTGLDPYATAVSNVYQDLYGAATYTGKGIYDLRAFHAALEGRFPDNRLLSHDLIEGEHVRVGLVNDVEVIEDYPSSYESYSKRKHRWVRGDWQIIEWLLPEVPVASGAKISNALPAIARWKMLDNLCRSMFEIALLAAVIASLTFAAKTGAHALIAVLVVILLPSYAGFIAAVQRPRPLRLWIGQLKESLSDFLRAHVQAFLSMSFLLHQALLMADAVIRTLIRRFVTHKKLLEWESMAQSEARAAGSDLVSLYLLACPAVAVLLILLCDGHTARALYVLMALWIASPLVARFVSAPPFRHKEERPDEVAFLRGIALETWRYFADFGVSSGNWLVPDNIQQLPDNITHQSSPTNVGLQLTATLAAFDFGYLTHQELADSVGNVLHTYGKLEKYKGHLYNWYDTRTLETLSPRYISTVDSGNLAAALVTLKQGLLAMPQQAVVDVSLIAGLRDCCLRVRNAVPPSLCGMSIMRPIAAILRLLECRPVNLFFWKGMLTDIAATVKDLNPHLEWTCEYLEASDARAASDLRYWQSVLNERLEAGLNGLCSLAPWLGSPYESELRARAANPQFQTLVAAASTIPLLGELPAVCDLVTGAAEELLSVDDAVNGTFRDVLAGLLHEVQSARDRCMALLDTFASQATTASRAALAMNFTFLLDRDRGLLRIGYNAETARLDDSYYDLLASEARTAVFFAVAKGDVPREVWFSLGRKLTSFRGLRALASWSGTMFEYLMPALFMRALAPTLLFQTMNGIVRIQQAYAREHGIPWGISESACGTRDNGLRYRYRAFGVPAMSLQRTPDEKMSLVVAPYATVLALLVDRRMAIKNLQDMASRGWVGRYGFFESIDFGSGRRSGDYQPTVVRSFMAHHQGMSLLALCNTLMDNIMQTRFHADSLVAAADRLLEERIPSSFAEEEEEETLEISELPELDSIPVSIQN